MARPTKLTPDVQERICQAIQLGATYVLSAQYGGVSYDAFNDWMNKGQVATSGANYQFYHAVKAAEARGVIGWLAKIEKEASEGSWQAAAWKLERRYPSEYGRSVHELSGPGKDGAILIKVEGLIDDGDSDPDDPH